MKPSDFIIIDLKSQGYAIEQFVKGWDKDIILKWLSTKGSLEVYYDNTINTEIYYFETIFGFRLIFILDDDQFTGIGSHYIFKFKKY